jgi:proline-specific peptidase
MKDLSIVEGTIPFKGYQTWYRRVGSSEAGKIPLLVLNGGPGFPHNYMESLDDLAENGREIIYYDQIGCGNSPAPQDADFYSVELFEQELTNVIKALDLKEFHMLGQSWGGMLLLSYMVTQKPQGVKSIVVSSAPASIPLLESEIKRLVSWLPPDAIAALEKGIKEETYDSPEFQAASNLYYGRYVISLDPMPDYVAYSFERQSEVYIIMQGRTEFMYTGKLKTWDITDRLHEITAPTLLISGVSDEITPFLVKQVYDRIPLAEWRLLQGTHLVHIERRDEYNRLVEAFLSKQEAC